MNANVMTRTIDVTAKEASRVGTPGTKEFNNLMLLRNAFPGFEINVIGAAQKRHGSNIRISLAQMKEYVEAHDDEAHSRMIEFNKLRGLDKDGNKVLCARVASIGEMKVWFLGTYPEIETFGAETEKILSNAKKAREERKAA